MKALTVCQPHAWAIVHGPKRVENRPWQTRFRGPLAIHAGLSRAWMGDVSWYLGRGFFVEESAFVFGAVIGVCDVVDCVEASSLADDPFASGPYCLVLDNVQSLREPILIGGK